MAEPPAKSPRRLSVVSLVLGLVALAGRLAFEASQADLGSDLGINAPWLRLLFNFGSVTVAGVGMAAAVSAAAAVSTGRARLGVFLPGFLVNGMAILWFAVWT